MRGKWTDVIRLLFERVESERKVGEERYNEL